MTDIKVSVILPSLNVVKYIRQCLDSVCRQTLKDIEIICVDAGSDDGTMEIMQEYANNDNRIRILNSDRKSYGYQMNIGMDAARGEYIGIVETDDYIDEHMYEELYCIAIEKDLDLIKSDFYRFIGEGDNLSVAYNALCVRGAEPHYNEIIDPGETQEVFKYLMNTWCGIYNRQYLVDNKICHNETPGASYQDNGFWFLSFMYAKRAYFLDKAYYYNRRDNEESSVRNKGKVCCICDEYRRLADILLSTNESSEKGKKRSTVKSAFTYAAFRAYNGNLCRIDRGYQKEFLIAWADDFRKYEEYGLVEESLLNENERLKLEAIRNNPESYYQRYNKDIDLFFAELHKKKKIIIYGAGMVGKRICDELMNEKISVDIFSFAVSDNKDNCDSYRGVPIKHIQDLIPHRNQYYVVIATTKRYQSEIENELKGRGFERIITYPSGE